MSRSTNGRSTIQSKVAPNTDLFIQRTYVTFQWYMLRALLITVMLAPASGPFLASILVYTVGLCLSSRSQEIELRAGIEQGLNLFHDD